MLFQAQLAFAVLLASVVTVNAVCDPQYQNCPDPCEHTPGPHSGRMFRYHEVDRLSYCNETMLLSYMIYQNLTDHDNSHAIDACIVNSTVVTPCVPLNPAPTVRPACLDVESQATTAFLQKAWWGTHDTINTSTQANVVAAARAVQQRFEEDCSETIATGYSNGVVVGAYIGNWLENSGAAAGMIEDFISTVEQGSHYPRLIYQICNNSSDFTMGIVADTSAEGALPFVQRALQTWDSAGCVAGYNDIRGINVPVKNLTWPGKHVAW